MKVTANAHRSGSWWVIHVPEVPGVFAQARRLDLVAGVVRTAVSLETDIPETDLEVNLAPLLDEQVERALSHVRAVRAEPGAPRAKETAALRYAARVLAAAGLSTREIGAAVSLPPQQARMLLESAGADGRAARAVSRKNAATKADAMAPVKAHKAALQEARNARLRAATSGHTDSTSDGVEPPSS